MRGASDMAGEGAPRECLTSAYSAPFSPRLDGADMEQEVKSHGIEYVFWDFDLGMRRKTYLPVKKQGSV